MKFGKKLISKNLKNYRLAKPDNDFWEKWRTNKEEMKAQGYYVNKEHNTFYVAFYDRTTATQEEYDAQELNKLNGIKNVFFDFLKSVHGKVDEKEIKKAENILTGVKSIKELHQLDYAFTINEVVKECNEQAIYRALEDENWDWQFSIRGLNA